MVIKYLAAFCIIYLDDILHKQNVATVNAAPRIMTMPTSTNMMVGFLSEANFHKQNFLQIHSFRL